MVCMVYGYIIHIYLRLPQAKSRWCGAVCLWGRTGSPEHCGCWETKGSEDWCFVVSLGLEGFFIRYIWYYLDRKLCTYIFIYIEREGERFIYIWMFIDSNNIMSLKFSFWLAVLWWWHGKIFIHMYIWNPNDPIFYWSSGFPLESFFVRKLEDIHRFQVNLKVTQFVEVDLFHHGIYHLIGAYLWNLCSNHLQIQLILYQSQKNIIYIGV